MFEDLDKKTQDGIYKSQDIFYKWAKRGSIIGQIKDKYGTTRWYAYLCVSGWPIHSIMYPMYMFYQLPKWLYPIDCFLGRYIVNPIFGKLIVKWKVFCYRQAYLECAKKFGPLPHSIDHYILFTEEELNRITTQKWTKI